MSGFMLPSQSLRLILRDPVGGQIASYIWLRQDEAADPHASAAWTKLHSDLENRLGLEAIGFGGSVAFAERADTYSFRGGTFTVHLESDPGDITVVSESRPTLEDLITVLCALGGYERAER